MLHIYLPYGHHDPDDPEYVVHFEPKDDDGEEVEVKVTHDNLHNTLDLLLNLEYEQQSADTRPIDF